LLLIRIVTGGFLLTDGLAKIAAEPPISSLIFGLASITAGVLLMAGLWTPAAGALVIAMSIADVCVFHENPRLNFLLATTAAAVIFIGPGALSLDARIFGPKKIDISKS
jgi:putative oxidoreductase